MTTGITSIDLTEQVQLETIQRIRRKTLTSLHVVSCVCFFLFFIGAGSADASLSNASVMAFLVCIVAILVSILLRQIEARAIVRLWATERGCTVKFERDENCQESPFTLWNTSKWQITLPVVLRSNSGRHEFGWVRVGHRTLGLIRLCLEYHISGSEVSKVSDTV